MGQHDTAPDNGVEHYTKEINTTHTNASRDRQQDPAQQGNPPTAPKGNDRPETPQNKTRG